MFQLVLLLLGIGVLKVQADCNVCSALTSVACVSETQFQFCNDNVLVEPVNSCPSGTFCTGSSTICQDDSSLRACNDCMECNSQRSFACLGVRTFALCLGTFDPSPITGSCAPDYVCNKDNPNICGLPSLGSPATCPLVEDEILTTVSPSANLTPDEYCQAVKQTGRFPYGTNEATTCRQYITCYSNKSVWRGALYNCPGSTYFQTTTKLCNTTQPAYCTATTAVQTLHVRNLRLL